MAWIEPQPLNLQLWYGEILVAQLNRCFPHQGTWFADYYLLISRGQDALRDRLIDYVTFCEDFHRRIGLGQDHDFTEFDRFGKIADTAFWRVPQPNGGLIPMEGKMWFADGQACWQHPESNPSTEAAANELWANVAEQVSIHVQSEP